MKRIALSQTVLLFFVFSFFSNCLREKELNKNRVYFEIPQKDRKVTIPIQINDTITAILHFDSGAVNSLNAITLDSSFISRYQTLLPDTCLSVGRMGLAWDYFSTSIAMYSNPLRIAIGGENIQYDKLRISDVRKILDNDKIDGFFNIPSSDTTHVWEFNFECNYLEIHEADNFRMPKKCFLAKMEDVDSIYPFHIQLPLEVVSKNGDRLSLTQTYLVDLGMPWDIALIRPTKQESDFLNKIDDAVCIRDNHDGYYTYHNVKGTLFDGFSMDSLRIYTLEEPFRLIDNYLVGINFLKRFNVYFDMKNRQIGLLPISNFKRIVNPDKQRFFYSSPPNAEGKPIVTRLSDQEGNFFKKAGLKVGDEIVKLEGSFEDTVIVRIIRDNKPMELVVPVEKGQVWGE